MRLVRKRDKDFSITVPLTIKWLEVADMTQPEIDALIERQIEMALRVFPDLIESTRRRVAEMEAAYERTH